MPEGDKNNDLEKRITDIALSAPGAEYIPSTDIAPRDFDLTEVPEEFKRDVELFLIFSADYIYSAIYLNDFPTHAERSAWEEEQRIKLEGEFGIQGGKNFYTYISSENKVPRNVIYKFESYARIMETYGGIEQLPQEPLSEMRELIRREVLQDRETGRDPWQEASKEHKKEVVGQIADYASEIISHFTSKAN